MEKDGLTRRRLLGDVLLLMAGFATGLLAPESIAEAKPRRSRRPRSRLREAKRGKLGTTLWLELNSAPFPFAGKRWKDNTVIVFVPHHHRLVRKDRKVDTVLHFHGHNTNAQEAMVHHQLREQLADSKQNAILVIPQLPLNADTGHPGKLSQPNGLLNLLTDLRKTMQSRKAKRALGKAALHPRSRIGTLCISAHSGGYRSAAACIRHGGFEVNEVYLFDSLYGDGDTFYEWLCAKAKPPGHKLISYYSGGKVAAGNRRLMRRLDEAGFAYLHERTEGEHSRQAITLARAVFVKTAAPHGRVTHQYNELRDCLYASRLKRRLKSRWFDHKKERRKLERRKKRRAR